MFCDGCSAPSGREPTELCMAGLGPEAGITGRDPGIPCCAKTYTHKKKQENVIEQREEKGTYKY